MFRYEINSIFKKHQFEDETDSEFFMGRHPLSKTDTGKQIKDEDDSKKLEYADVFRPPGLVKIKTDVRYFDDGAQKSQGGSSLSHVGK